LKEGKISANSFLAKLEAEEVEAILTSSNELNITDVQKICNHYLMEMVSNEVNKSKHKLHQKQ